MSFYYKDTVLNKYIKLEDHLIDGTNDSSKVILDNFYYKKNGVYTKYCFAKRKFLYEGYFKLENYGIKQFPYGSQDDICVPKGQSAEFNLVKEVTTPGTYAIEKMNDRQISILGTIYNNTYFRDSIIPNKFFILLVGAGGGGGSTNGTHDGNGGSGGGAILVNIDIRWEHTITVGSGGGSDSDGEKTELIIGYGRATANGGRSGGNDGGSPPDGGSSSYFEQEGVLKYISSCRGGSGGKDSEGGRISNSITGTSRSTSLNLTGGNPGAVGDSKQSGGGGASAIGNGGDAGRNSSNGYPGSKGGGGGGGRYTLFTTKHGGKGGDGVVQVYY